MENTSAEQFNNRNINVAPRFVEPQVHPDIDAYMRGKLRDASSDDFSAVVSEDLRAYLQTDETYNRLVTQAEAIPIKRVGAQRLDDPHTEARVRVSKYVDQVKEQRKLKEIQRLQDAWREAASGNFTTISTEIAQDITNQTHTIARNLQSPYAQEDVERYDTSVAEFAEWQASLQETPVNPATRLGKQIQKTVFNLIQQRDNTHMGQLHKQLKQLQRVQNTISIFSNASTGK